jgi:hypothetical protein
MLSYPSSSIFLLLQPRWVAVANAVSGVVNFNLLFFFLLPLLQSMSLSIACGHLHNTQLESNYHTTHSLWAALGSVMFEKLAAGQTKSPAG